MTGYDSEYETMSEQLDAIKSSTERIISFVQAMVQPNPGPDATLFLLLLLLLLLLFLFPLLLFKACTLFS